MDQFTRADSRTIRRTFTGPEHPLETPITRFIPGRSMTSPLSSMRQTSPAWNTPQKPEIEKELCDFCQTNIILSEARWGMHHQSAEGLRISSEGDCKLCSQLWSDVCDAGDDRHSLVWPLYRWNIRGPQRIGDTDEVYATLVFRQTVSIQSFSVNEAGSIRLPERSFLLFQQRNPARKQSHLALGNSTLSEQTKATIHRWLSECSETHSACQKRADVAFMPTRLLDLGRGERIYCVETSSSNIEAPYITLSYCWGSHKFINLSPSNRQEFISVGMDGSVLPQTIRDAIRITRALGVRYLWVDSLCIVQGPDGDFAQEGSLMLHVYRNSFVNLAATDSSAAHNGILRVRDSNKLVDAEFQASPNSTIFGNSLWRVVPKALWDEQVLSASLNSRAWVFQERLLSPRLLHFTQTQVFWDCATTSACETFPDGLPMPLDTGSTDRYWRWKLQDTSDLNTFLPTIVDDSLELFWRSAIKTYSGCKLTFKRDKLIAIWGIVSFLISALKETYAVGMWERNLEEQLAWHVIPGSNHQVLDAFRGWLDTPTWSWASADGVVELPDRFAAVRDYHVTDHEGRRIAFKLATSSETQASKPRALRTWKEQLLEYNRRLSEMDAIRKQGYEQKPRADSKPHLTEVIPPLETKSIEIQGHIGSASMRKDSLSSGWTLKMPLLAEIGADIEVFPDLDPGDDPDENVLFLLLAMTLCQLEGSKSKLVRSRPNDLPETYEGIGLLVERVPDVDMHFVRTGAFRFRGVNLAALRNSFELGSQELGTVNTYDTDKGHKIWLC